jgi:hypothetical protein
VKAARWIDVRIHAAAAAFAADLSAPRQGRNAGGFFGQDCRMDRMGFRTMVNAMFHPVHPGILSPLVLKR